MTQSISRPEVITSIADLRERLRGARMQGADIALVPTMGALHDGHLALVDRAVQLADTVVVSIFVNPLQFGAGEDLDRYPRTLEADLEALATRGAHLVFAPSASEMYPHGETATRVTAGPVGSTFEGASRPGHFDGMLTVVAKLFNIVQPRVAVFGEKDAQQVFLVKQMVADLDLPVSIEVVDIVRDAEGLALSSRNRYLSDQEREQALALCRALAATHDAATEGAGVDAALNAGREVLGTASGVDPDYFEIVDTATFEPVGARFRGDARAVVAARVGSARLIDTRAVRFA
ncbi:pantoate--beta-alanine ligase [Ruicaihuangia caeni]|uniref:Pantothenate synthetase n=1 Tax=Ruicaihuangia caeni TaxID=3042517 RepID=A0AAW6TAX2_9MICO|nr:pantoate--beta-alanine ligase [Klugiella sp. YN-L-19]MDI2098460.1 pantoate--beta-alanine ligase [Klugiella sp. YN-L-19]